LIIKLINRAPPVPAVPAYPREQLYARPYRVPAQPPAPAVIPQRVAAHRPIQRQHDLPSG
jgi:hypothetical protein